MRDCSIRRSRRAVAAASRAFLESASLPVCLSACQGSTGLKGCGESVTNGVSCQPEAVIASSQQKRLPMPILAPWVNQPRSTDDLRLRRTGRVVCRRPTAAAHLFSLFRGACRHARGVLRYKRSGWPSVKALFQSSAKETLSCSAFRSVCGVARFLRPCGERTEIAGRPNSSWNGSRIAACSAG